MRHRELHRSHRVGWLRAVVLGANDGIVSTASLVLGVAAADATPEAIVTAGIAGRVGGSLSMAVGEYVSVSSQRDVEKGDIARERAELASEPERELVLAAKEKVPCESRWIEGNPYRGPSTVRVRQRAP